MPALPYFGLPFRLSRRLYATPLRYLSTYRSRAMDYNTILQGKYPAKQHAKRVVDHLRSKVPGATGVLYLEGRMTKLIEDNDEPEPFRYVQVLPGRPG